MDDQRHMTPAYRRKFRNHFSSSLGPPKTQNYPVYQPPQYLESTISPHSQEEIENNFHEDRQRNLQSFFKG